MFKGKALLVIDCVEREGRKMRWEVWPCIQSLNRDDPGGEVTEAFSFVAACGVHPLPNPAYKMNVGDRIRVLVSFEIHYSQSYEGEWDSDIYYERVKVLRKQPYKPRKERKWVNGLRP